MDSSPMAPTRRTGSLLPKVRPPASGAAARARETARAIGGYHEFELRAGRGERHRDAHAYQSARAAFLALLLATRPRRVWIPWYICESMTDAARLSPVAILRYGLDEDFRVDDRVELARGDLLLYVNYFGLCDANVDATVRRFGAARVAIDDSHAYYSRPRDCAGTLYSPRKFVGAPDGGYLVTRAPVAVPEAEDTLSLERCLPLLTRVGADAESGYAAYLASQASLDGQMPLRMSMLTRRLLAAVDYADVARRRRAHFGVLESSLAGRRSFPLRRSRSAVPMSYPLLDGDADLRERLLANRIYVPRYWPHLVQDDAAIPAFERHLAHHCIPLPCDQHLGRADLERMVAIVGAPPARRRRSPA
jgi:hypothetical protein